MPKFQLNKLVRDKIVEKSQDLGITVEYQKLEWKEAVFALLNKVQEESRELNQETDSQNIVKELVDIQQAIHDLLDMLKISESEFMSMIKAKQEKSWWFKQGLYVKTMEMDETNPRSDYYKKDPQRFPEVE